MRPYTIEGGITDTKETTVDPHFNHITVGLTIYTDDTKDTVASAPTGTIAIEGKIRGNSGWTPFDGSPIDVSDTTLYVTNSAHLEAVRAVPSSLAGDAGHYEVQFSCSDS